MASWAEMGGANMERRMRGPDGFGSKDELASHLRSTARPFVLISERELSVLRRGLTKQGWKRALYLQPASGSFDSGAGLLARANQWLERTIDIPGRSGHAHHFFCDDGTRLELPPDYKVQPDGYKCPACGKVYQGENYDGGLRWYENQAMAAGALSLALVYAIERDKEYADKAAEILLGYAKKYPGPHTTNLEGGQMLQSLDESLWIIRLAQAYDLIYHSSSLHDEDRRTIEQRLLKPAAQGLVQAGVHGNWGSWHLSAVGVVGLAIKDAELVCYALEKFTDQMRDELGSDGLWPESVHTYHFFALSAFTYFAEACYRTGIDLYNWEAKPGKGLKAMFTVPIQYTYPSFQLPAINDGWYRSFMPLGLYEIAYRRWGGPAFAWVLKTGYRFGDKPVNKIQENSLDAFKRNSFYAFLFGRDLPGRVVTPALSSTDFDNIGICTLRSNAAMLTFHYGPFVGHGQRDKMGITIYGGNNVLVPDYGTPGYGSKILNYYLETPSHNTVVVDGKSQEHSRESKLIEFRTGDLLQVADAETEDAYPGVTHRRRIYMVGGSYIVHDTLASEEEHTFDWMLHAEGKLLSDLSPALDGAQTISYQCVQQAASYSQTSTFKASWSLDDAGLGLSMWTDQPSTPITCQFPAETGARTVDTLVVRTSGKSAQFLSVLCPHGDGQKPVCTVENGLIKIASGKTAYWVHFTGAPMLKPSAQARLKSDTAIAVVETVEDQPVRCAFLGGREIMWDRGVLVESSDYLDHFEAQLQARSPMISCEGGNSGYLKLRSSCRAMRLNGHRVSASNNDGIAVLRLLPRAEPVGRW